MNFVINFVVADKDTFLRPQILAWGWKTRFDDAANDHGKKHVEK